MTHAESQDLLLDLAYGELDAARAAEVERHVSSCPECRKEKEAIEEARRVAAPIRELEEPSSGFDHRILQAARAQAQLEHDGNVGQVIEVTGTVRPLGVDAARIDAHAPVKARPAERRRARWMVRTAVAGSVAAAAALALVVGNTLDAKRNAEKAAAARASDFEIRVQAPPSQAADSARDAEAKREEKDQDQVPVSGGGIPAAPPQEKPHDSVTRLPLRRRSASRIQGSGGDAVESQGKMAAKKAKEALTESGPVATAAPAPGTAGTEPAARPAPAVPAAAQPARSTAIAPAPPSMEADAQQARHSGNYALAASLYREAAAARQRGGDASTAAWNLAHAVECLSAAGQFDEARKVRDELARLYPAETTALSAAKRALREVDVPAAKGPGDPPR